MQAVRVRLLNDGTYGGADNVKFPVVVNATLSRIGFMCDVHHDELHRVGFDGIFEDDAPWPFAIGLECEILP